MNNKPLVSIIIPVYNVEFFLPKCIESILAQDYEGWELILVDDGSSDNSGIICDEYAKKDKRICVIHKCNGGVSVARNLGIEHSKGSWVLFIDSDDWIESNYLSSFFKYSVTPSSLTIQGILVDNGKSLIPIGFSDCIIDESHFCEDIVKYQILKFGGPVCKLYNAGIIKKNKILFPEEYSFGEDSVFFYHYLTYINEIRLLGINSYHYMQEPSNSLTKRIHSFTKLNHFISDSFYYLNQCKNIHSDVDNLIVTSYVEYMMPQMIRACLNSYRNKQTKQQILHDLDIAKTNYGYILTQCNHSFKSIIFKYYFKLPKQILYYINYLLYKLRG